MYLPCLLGMSGHLLLILLPLLGPLLNGGKNINPPGSNQWFKDGLAFGCTGCGKCCKMDGDVWLSPEEQPAIAAALGETVGTFREKYTRQILKEWACLNYNNVSSSSSLSSLSSEALTTTTTTTIDTTTTTTGVGCVFLSNEGQCRIYETRPVQCRTYPFWPSLLEDREAWEEEAVVPDDVPLLVDNNMASSSSSDNRHWTLDEGGCEGINHVNAPLVPADEIEMKRREARAHWRRFPNRKIKHDTWYL